MVIGNPAQQLLQLLNAFDNTGAPTVSIRNCWRTVLGCTEDELSGCLASAMQLVGEVRGRVVSQGPKDQLRVVNRYEDLWLQPFMPPRGWKEQSSGLVDEDSLLALSTLAALFAVHAPYVRFEAEQSSTLLDLLNEARAAVVADADLPAALRTLILERIHDVQWAVEHYNVAGAEGLQGALDRLGAEMTRSSRHGGSWRKKAGTAVLYGCLALGGVGDVVDGIEASATVVEEFQSWVVEARAMNEPELLELPTGGANDAEPPQDIVDGEIIEEDDQSTDK